MNRSNPHSPRKGRGSISNRSGRFESQIRHAINDDWTRDEDVQPPTTLLREDTSRTIIVRNSSPDIPFDRSINPYRGCEHGCVYCFARPTHAYLGLSPGLDFETQLFFKPEAAQLLEAELRRPSYRCNVIAMGTNTDPYQPVERDKRITRQILEVLTAFDHPVGIVTKSTLVLRDLDILAPMAARGLAQVCVSVTTLDRNLARRLEPRAATPSRRIETIRTLAAAGVPTGVMASPMIPGLNDHELEAILSQASAAGAEFASYILIRLPLEIADLFAEWLKAHVPNRAKRVMSLIRETRGGKTYQSKFGLRMRGTGTYAELLTQRFQLAVDRLRLNERRLELNTGQFTPPPTNDDQFELFS